MFIVGYALTKFTIHPFSENDLTNDPKEACVRKEWNFQLSHIRIAIEHAFGCLKGRFPLLRGLPGNNLDEMYKLIEALLITHNILTELGDDPKLIEGFNGAEILWVCQIRLLMLRCKRGGKGWQR